MYINQICSIQVQVLNNFSYFSTFSNVFCNIYLSGWRWFCFILLHQWERQGHSIAVLSLPTLLHPEMRYLSLGRFLHHSLLFPKTHAHFILIAGYLNLLSKTVCLSFIKKKQKQAQIVQDLCRSTQNAAVMLTTEFCFFCVQFQGLNHRTILLSSKLVLWLHTPFSCCCGGFGTQPFVSYSNF